MIKEVFLGGIENSESGEYIWMNAFRSSPKAQSPKVASLHLHSDFLMCT
jgi:hypothetical protein